jgi:hypothetical protein
MSDVRRFILEIKGFCADVPKFVQENHRKLTLEGLRRIATRTPVDTGHARNNWQIGVGNMPEGIKGIRPKKKPGQPRADEAAVLAKVMAEEGPKAATIPPFGVSHITNNVKYIVYLENGSSKLAPGGMVSLSVEELSRLRLE